MPISSRSLIKTWFVTRAKPLATQFASWMDSYWHKEDSIPIDSIENLTNTLATISSGIGGGGGGGGSTTYFAATKAAANALVLTAGSWVRVAADESNNGDKTMYLKTVSTLEYQYTIQSL